MISSIRQHVEETLQIPIHFVHLIEGEQLPCGTIRQTQSEHHQELRRSSGWRVAGVSLALWSLSYLELEQMSEAIFTTYDGQCVDIDDAEIKFIVDDCEDDSYVNPDGSDDWVYSKEITLRVHFKS